MRIIAGEFRSRVLQAPPGMRTRPTTDRLRETLFNVLQGRLAGARFLDLYAGSGANGLEALSRGAAEAVFLEQAPPALAAIRGNVATLGVGGRARVNGVPVRRWLRIAAEGAGGLFDIVFLDPPYADADEYAGTLELLGGEAGKLLAAGAVVVGEHRRAREGEGSEPQPRSKTAPRKQLSPSGFALSEQYGSLRRTRVLEQGDAQLSFFSRSECPEAFSQ